MTLSYRIEQNSCLLNLEKTLTEEDRGSILRYVDFFLQNRILKRIVIRIENMTGDESSVFQTIVSIFNKTQQSPIRLSVCEGSPDLNEYFYITGLDNFIGIYPSIEEAMKCPP